ncbi:calcium-binding protein [Streptomyces sp. T12]|uniref:calcium-binding protein n=3 Tax=unclassified Streptomyces TaxID=2593676 RepID=UPI00236510F4|nr:calcium-binding protein [Streptomyces sp. T12]WDF42272.1 calcium-binding protein [Streptomyces sp. T12]
MPILPSLRGSLRAVTALVAALAFVVAVPHGAFAAPGDLDPTFGTGGKVSITTDTFAEGQDMAIQPDGRIISVGWEQDAEFLDSEFALTRHNSDGSVDTSFGGGDGEVLTDFENGEDVAQGVAVQPDGKIVVVGRHQETDDEFAGCCWFTVARYNADGSVDTAFGGGDGWVSPGLAGGAEDAAGVAVQPDGKIVAGARAGGSFAVVRYLPDGSPDGAFGGGDGVSITSFSDVGGAVAQDMALQPDGKIVLVGYSGETNFDFALARYNSDGSLDTTFSGDGRVTTDLGGYNWGETVVVQSSGKIVASGSSGGRFTLVRYNVDGSRDSGFGTGGVATADFGSTAGVYDLALQPDDRIIAGGGGAVGDFALARFNADGSLDTGFGTDGRITTDFGVGDRVNSLAVQPDGKIVAFGSNSDGLRALARYLGGVGTPPPPPPPTEVDLSVAKYGPGTVSIGDRATYTLTVTNNSTTIAATGVSLTDTLTGPAATVISATPGQGTCTTSATGATCALGTLATGASTTVSVVVEPRATGTLTQRATVSATQTDPATADNTATVTTTVNNSRLCTRIGTSGNDTMTGTSGTDIICGLGGDDTINAGAGNDTVYGNFGNDRADGGLNNDTLNGGPGNDNLIGYYGNDSLNTVDNVSGNDTANGGPGTDTCTTDTGDTRISCP